MAHENATDPDRRYWERRAARYDRLLRPLAAPMPRVSELAASTVPPGARVLEVGAGTGLVTRALAQNAREVVATDYAAAMVVELERRVRSLGLTNVRCERADLYALPYERGSFDVVVGANLLHLVPDLERALSALAPMLTPGGLLVVPTYCHRETVVSSVVSRLMAFRGFPGRRRFTLATLRSALHAAGGDVTRAELVPGLIPIGYVEARFERK